MLGYLSMDIICSEKRTVFREQSSRKTVSYEEQIMSKDKYPNIFSPQMATIVFIILQIFFATREVLKIGEYSQIFHSFCCGIFGHVTRLGQSCVSKKIWWIIMGHIPWWLIQWKLSKCIIQWSRFLIIAVICLVRCFVGRGYVIAAIPVSQFSCVGNICCRNKICCSETKICFCLKSRIASWTQILFPKRMFRG